ncbi:MAG TPA: type II CAAX endopeptidase family protein [Chthonomonadales bacterium]|nr:type II CAAX endopeptidase family protein [Chthonomonadales bacterium]
MALEPEGASSAPPRSSFWWRGALGAALLALLVTGVHRTTRSPEETRSAAAARAEVEALWAAKAAHLSGWRTEPGGRPSGGLVLSLRRLVALDPKDRNRQRALLIVQAALGDAGWRSTADGLGSAAGAAGIDARGERALWIEAFGGPPPSAERAREIVASLERMRLGWYRLVAREIVYTRASMGAEARDARQLATRWFWRLMPLAALMLGAAVWGMGLLALALFAMATKRLRPSLRWMLTNSAPGRLDRRRADVLYATFLIYLLAFLTAKLVGPLALPLLGDPPSVRAQHAASVTLMVLVTVAPLLAYRRFCRQHGMGAEHLGLRKRPWLPEALWGVAAYCATLPLVIGATLLSAWVFDEQASPLHPIVTEMAVLADPIVMLLLAFQAVVLAPIVEELMFRGAFFGGVAPRIGAIGAIIVTSAAFALMHPQLPVGFAGLFLLGASMCGLYAVRGSIVGPIVFHGVNNGVAFLLLWALSAT